MLQVKQLATLSSELKVTNQVELNIVVQYLSKNIKKKNKKVDFTRFSFNLEPVCEIPVINRPLLHKDNNLHNYTSNLCCIKLVLFPPICTPRSPTVYRPTHTFWTKDFPIQEQKVKFLPVNKGSYVLYCFFSSAVVP